MKLRAKRTWRRSCRSCGSRSVSTTSACSSKASASMPTITPTHTNTATVALEEEEVATATVTRTEPRCPRSRTAACRPNSIGRGRIGAEDTPEEDSRSAGTKNLSNFRRGRAPTERPRERGVLRKMDTPHRRLLCLLRLSLVWFLVEVMFCFCTGRKGFSPDYRLL
uniref:(northern house mosquito) hypothetical protein n=1 Tax=Culex pipiens TaxID=7175 RepID=A0A8D8HXJ7_CULPI